MQLLEKYDVNPLSTNLTGYGNYLKNLGLGDRQIGFLKLAPRKLFQLFGTYSSVELLKYDGFRLKFLDVIKPNYEAGTLKKYSSGITHYRNYLISEKIIVATKKHNFCQHRYDEVRESYHKNKSSVFIEVEERFYQYLTIERKYCSSEIRKIMASYQRFASHVIDSGVDCFSAVIGEQVIEFRSLETTHKTDWNKLKVFLKFAYREGFIQEGLSVAIISAKKNRMRRKKYLSEAKIEKLLESVVRSNTTGQRTYTMFLLMARMGFRPCETVRIRLKDIDWVNGKILVRGKDNRLDWLPMSIEVADAIIAYLKVSKRGEGGLLICKREATIRSTSQYQVFKCRIEISLQNDEN